MGSPVPLNGKWKVDLRRAVINETNWHWSGDPADGITGVALTLTPDEQRAWVIEAQGGIVRQEDGHRWTLRERPYDGKTRRFTSTRAASETGRAASR